MKFPFNHEITPLPNFCVIFVIACKQFLLKLVIMNRMSSKTMKLNMEVEIIFWSDVNKPCWLTTGDPASSRGRSSMAIKLDDTNDEKVWGQISIKESRMGEQNAWRGKTSLMYDACILAMYCGDFIYYPGNFVLVNGKSRWKNHSICVLYT